MKTSAQIQSISLAGLLVFLIGTAVVSATIITDEDFEGGATGWSDNTTTVGAAAFSEFLGRHPGSGGSQSLFKTFALPGTQTGVAIIFDFYEIDGWDGEDLILFVDDVAIHTDTFDQGVFETPLAAANLAPLNPPVADLGFGAFNDQTYRYAFVLANTNSTLKIGFGTTLDEALENESWGIDNVRIITSGELLIPEPATILLALLGLIPLSLHACRDRKRA